MLQPYTYKGMSRSKQDISPATTKDESNIIKIKNLSLIVNPSVLVDRNEKQLRYALKCFHYFNHNQIFIFARGAATHRGF